MPGSVLSIKDRMRHGHDPDGDNHARASGRDELRAGEIVHPKADLATIHDLHVVEADRQLSEKRQKWRTHKVDPCAANMGDHVFIPPAIRIEGSICPNLTIRSIMIILFVFDHSFKIRRA